MGVQKEKSEGRDVAAPAGLFLYLLLAVTAGFVLLVFTAVTEVSPGSTVVFALFSLLVPVFAYVDTRRVYEAEEKTKSQSRSERLAWVVGMTVPGVSLSFAIAYAFRRREVLGERQPRWWSLVALSPVVWFLSVLIFYFLGGPGGYTPVETAAGITSVAVLPLCPLSVYHDGGYVSDRTGWPPQGWLYAIVVGAGVPFLNLSVCPAYLYVRRVKKSQLEDTKDRFEYFLKEADELYDEGEMRRENGDYDAAEEALRAAIERLQEGASMVESSRHLSEARASEVKGKVEKVKNRRKLNEVERAVSEGDELLSKAEKLDQPKEAADAYESASIAYREAIEATRDNEGNIRGEIEDESELDRAHRGLTSSLLGLVRKRTEEAERYRSSREYDNALGACREAISAADRAREVSEGQDENSLRVLERYREEAERFRDKTEKEHESYGEVSDHLTDVKGGLAAASDELDSGNHREATQRLDELRDRLEDISETVEEHGLEDLRGSIEELEKRQKSLRRSAQVSEGTQKPPSLDTVPSPPCLSLEYGDIKKDTVLGAGGEAGVYRATVPDPSDATDGELTVAVKEPHRDGTLHTETVERMMEEAETWQNLDDHENIVSVVDYGTEPLPWIAMEYMDSGHLGKRAGEIDFEQAVWTAICVTKAIRHAHRRGVAHLDLKPENVLFRTIEGEDDGRWDFPKVADWGLSKKLLNTKGSKEAVSPMYAAPEQFDGSYGETDNITDVYQLGTLFYELFTGTHPYEGAGRITEEVLHGKPEPPSELADLPPEVDDVVLTAMATERSERYEDVLLLREELQSLYRSVV